MKRRFDEAVDASWTSFEKRVAEGLKGLGQESCEIELADAGDVAPLIWLQGEGEHVTALLVGLSAEHDVAVVEVLGWHPPDEDEPGSLWGMTLPVAEAEVLAGMVSGALRYVFDVADPVFVAENLPGPASVPSPAVDHGEAAEAAEVIGYPSCFDELVDLVERALAVNYGPEIVRDDDGDYPIRAGVVPLWVRVHDDAPVVRLFSYVVRSVRDRRQARIEIGILNRRTPLLKFHLDERVITATYDLPAVPLLGTQLLHTIDRVSELLNDLAGDLALRVDGKLWLDGIGGGSPVAECEDPT